MILGFALFFAAYQAEIIRGGMGVIPPGQDEAALALGLSYSRWIALVTLPQAFRNAMPPTINQIVVTFKETSLVIIVGFSRCWPRAMRPLAPGGGPLPKSRSMSLSG